MGLYRELEKLSLPALVIRFKGRCPEGSQYAAGYRLEIASLIKARGPRGIKFLREELRGRDAARVRAAIFALTSNGRPALNPRALLAFLRDKRGPVVAEAIDSLAHLQYGKAKAKVRPLISKGSPYVVGAALRYVSALDKRTAKPLLLKALRHRSFVVRDNACDLLDELNAADAIPHMTPLLRDPHRFTRQAARTAIRNLRARAAKKTLKHV